MRRDPELLPSAFVALALFGRNRDLYRVAWRRSVRNGDGAPTLDLTARDRRQPDPWWFRPLAVGLFAVFLFVAFLRPVVAWLKGRR